MDVDDGVPVAAVDEKVTQQGTKHHDNMAKLELRRARAKTHRRVLATVMHTQRRCCRSRGRKARTAFPRWTQASRMGRLGAQGAGGAVTGFATTGRHYGDDTSSTEQRRRRREKQGRRTEKNGDGEDFIARLRSKKKPRRSLLHASAKLNVATSAPGSQRKLANGEVSPEDTVHRNYRIATHLFSQITPKFVW